MAKFYHVVSPSVAQNKNEKKYKDPYCVPAIRLAHQKLFYQTFEKSPSRAFKVDNLLLAKLVEDFGNEGTYNICLGAIDNWDMIKKKIRAYGLPTIKTIYNLRFGIVDALEEGHKNSVSYNSVVYDGRKQNKKKTTKKVSGKKLFFAR